MNMRIQRNCYTSTSLRLPCAYNRFTIFLSVSLISAASTRSTCTFTLSKVALVSAFFSRCYRLVSTLSTVVVAITIQIALVTVVKDTVLFAFSKDSSLVGIFRNNYRSRMFANKQTVRLVSG